MQYDQEDLHNTVIEPDLDEIHDDDATVTCNTEAHIVLQMAADGESMGSIYIRVDTGAG